MFRRSNNNIQVYTTRLHPSDLKILSEVILFFRKGRAETNNYYLKVLINYVFLWKLNAITF